MTSPRLRRHARQSKKLPVPHDAPNYPSELPRRRRHPRSGHFCRLSFGIHFCRNRCTAQHPPPSGFIQYPPFLLCSCSSLGAVQTPPHRNSCQPLASLSASCHPGQSHDSPSTCTEGYCQRASCYTSMSTTSRMLRAPQAGC